ncbi:hypothetical protein D3C73_1231470 [compost metagenome]
MAHTACLLTQCGKLRIGFIQLELRLQLRKLFFEINTWSQQPGSADGGRFCDGEARGTSVVYFAEVFTAILISGMCGAESLAGHHLPLVFYRDNSGIGIDFFVAKLSLLVAE